MENKIRKAIKEQIRKLKEGMSPKLSRLGNAWFKDYVNMYFEGGDEPGTPGEQGEFEITRIEQGNPQKYDDSHLARKFLEELRGLGSIVVRYDDYIGDIKVTSDREGDAIVTWVWPGPVGEGMSDEEWADAKEKERLDQHPEKDKINKIKQMVDKEEDDKEQAEYDKGWYGESLKEKATELGYLKEASKYDEKSQEEFNLDYDELSPSDAEWIRYEVDNEGYLEEEVDEQGLDQIEMGLNQITGGGRQSAGVSDRGDKIRVMFRYMRGEFDGETWETILEYLSDNMGYKILDQSNYYEANYDREEPAEAVPMIHLKKNKSPIYPTNQKLRMFRTGPKNKPLK